MATVELDAIDLKILRILRIDGRISKLDLADRVALSPSPCSRRVKRLEQLGIISGYAASVDPVAVGLDVSVFVSVRLQKTGGSPAQDFREVVRDMPEVYECYLVTGPFDYVLRVRTRGVDGFKRFILDCLSQIPGVAETSTQLVIDESRFERELVRE